MITTMATKKKKTTIGGVSAPGWRMPDHVQDDFKAWCDKLGLGYEAECAGAVFVWSRLPSELREWAKAAISGDETLDEAFWRAFADAFDEAIRALRKLRQERSQTESQ